VGFAQFLRDRQYLHNVTPATLECIHATRHTFSTEYLGRGGNVFYLQRVLGHTTLAMVQRYAGIVTADLQAVHERISLLSSH
jgi:site-specific recombinase XerD